jgi:hypothetical protein
MNEYPNILKEKLLSIICDMNPNDFVKNPGKDFTRNRKLPFDAVMKLLITMGGNSICKELLEASDYDEKCATTSAFVQQREKILPYAFEFVFHKFNEVHSDVKLYKGYRLLAVDGSDFNISTNSEDSDSYYKTSPESKGYNLLHLNAFYDLLGRHYVDAIVEPSKKQNERNALISMLNRSAFQNNFIVIGDRNFEGYNVFANIENKGGYYLIRVKDLDSNGIVAALPLPDADEFDITFTRTLTYSRTRKVKDRPDIYRILPKRSHFDFLNDETPFYEISFRVVRVKISDNLYETLITNLPEYDFTPSELKKLYSMRWGIETSFRELKYSIGLINFHSKKRECITQEIFARMIMFNFAQMITSHVVIEKADTKYAYQVNFTMAIHICRRFLRSPCDAHSRNIEALISKYILPVRPDRTAKRNIQRKTIVSFIYRVA